MAVAAGAFGAHVLSGLPAEWVKTGAFYALIHAVAVLVIAPAHPRPGWLMLTGATIFSWTLYAMGAGAPRWLGAITPIGGVMMILAWLWLAAAYWRGPQIKP